MSIFKNQQPKLGDAVRDVVTGFEGIVVSRTEWLNKCVRMGVQARVGKDGTLAETSHIDVEQLEVVKRNAVSLVTEPSGGDRPAPRRAPDPKR